MTSVSHGKPCAGNPHARFEEGASASEKPRRNALLHNLNRASVVLLILVKLVISATGCRDYERTASEIVTGKIEKLPMTTEEHHRRASECGDDICRLFNRVPANRKKELIGTLTACFRKLEFDQSSYAIRAAALSDYLRIVSELSGRFRSAEDIQDAVWRFRLDALDRVNEEIRRCENEPAGGVYGMKEIGYGPFMTKQLYLESLESMRADFVWRWFEMGPFSLFFKSLPEKDRADWKNRIEKVARRKVSIWDSDNPFGEMPIRPDDTSGLSAGTNECGEFLVPIQGGVIKMRCTDKWKGARK